MSFGIEDIREEYERLDRLTGVDTSRVSLRISGRMTRKLGEFKTSGSLIGMKREIAISSKCLEDEELFYEVIRHEYAHAVVSLRHPLQRHVHDETWKAVCRQIGCRPKATIKLDGSFRGNTRAYKYEVVCKNCGASSKYKTRSKVVQYAAGKPFCRLTCRRCGGHSFEVREI